MKNITANHAKTRFGELLMNVQKSPVQIDKNGRPVAVVMSIEDYQATEKLKEAWFAQRMADAESEIKSRQLIDSDRAWESILEGLDQ